MSTMNVNVDTVIFEIKDKFTSVVRRACLTLAEMDADFCGDNGDEYLWNEVDSFNKDHPDLEPIESNARYVFSMAFQTWESKTGVEGLIKNFAKEWHNRDHYYDSIEVKVVKLNGEPNTEELKGIYAATLILTDYN